MNRLIILLLGKSRRVLWLVSTCLSIMLTLPIVAMMQLILEGKVTTNYLLTGFVAALLVACAISGLLIHLLKTLNQLHQDNQYLNALINQCPVPIAIYQRRGEITYINAEFTRLFGYLIDDIPSIPAFLEKACSDKNTKSLLERLLPLNSASNTPSHPDVQLAPVALDIYTKNQETKSTLVSSAKMNAKHNDSQLLVCFDISEQTRLLDKMTESRHLLQLIIETIPMRIYWKDINSQYIGCNNKFARDAGLKHANEVTGKQDADLGWIAHNEAYRAIDQEVMQNRSTKMAYLTHQKSHDGSDVTLKSTLTPLCNQSGEVVGVLGIYDDITQLTIAEAEQSVMRERLNFALQGANDGLWDWNLETNQVYYSPRWKSMLGYQDSELENNIETWSELVDPEVRAQTLALAKEYIDGHRTSFETEFRMKHKQGYWVEILSRAKLAVDQDGVPLTPRRLIGTHVDISHLKYIERELRKKEGYQRALLDNFPFMVWLKDVDSRFLSVNKVHAQNYGEEYPESLAGKTDYDISPIEIAEAYRQDDLTVMRTMQPKSLEETYIDPQGQINWIETFKAPVTDQEGNLLGTVGFARDISERKRTEAEFRIAATAFESQEGMIVTDAYANILKINHSFTRITGYTAEDAVGQKMKLLKSGVHDAAFYKEMWDSITTKGSWQGEIWNKRKNGDIYPEWLTITAVKNNENVVTHYVGTMIDITARKSIEERVHHLAHYDPLTDLPNRTLLTDRLHQALAQARRETSRLALMFLDLDKFKPVNDQLGHEIGDALLKEVANRLTACIKRQTDTVSRIGGDEFVILLSQIETEQDAAMVANEVVSALTQPFLIESHDINISCSVGIAFYPMHGVDAKSLLQVADQAMYDAKRAGRGCFRFYSDNTSLSSPDNLTELP